MKDIFFYSIRSTKCAPTFHTYRCVSYTAWVKCKEKANVYVILLAMALHSKLTRIIITKVMDIYTYL